MNTKMKVDKGIIFLLIMAMTILLSAGILYFSLRSNPVLDDVGSEKQIRTLLFVHDGVNLIDIELLMFSPKTLRSALIHIPPNTVAYYAQQKKWTGLSAAYTPGGSKKEIVAMVGSVLKIEAPYFLEIEQTQLCNFIDLLGGIHLFLIDPVEYKKDGQLLLIPAGAVTMDGFKSQIYMSYVDPYEGIGEQIRRRQIVVREVIESLKPYMKEGLSGKNEKILFSHFQSNMSFRSLSTYFKELSRIETSLMILQPLRGEEKVVDGQNLLFPNDEGKWIKIRLEQIVSSLEDEVSISEAENNIKIELLNGTKRNNLATRTSLTYQDFGYDVIRVSNASRTDYLKTVVIDHMDNPKLAKKVADLIKCTRIETKASDTPTQVADITIILGEDFDGITCR